MFSPLRPNTVVDRRYRVVELLGSGGMGQVYRARHDGLGRDVALKVIHARGLSDANAMRLEREARAIARLDHPGCVRVLDYGRTYGRHFLAMELIDGRPLSWVLNARGALPASEVVDIARQVLAALSHAHAQGVLHRDIKPGNVMIEALTGRVVVIDFGLAHVRDEAGLTAHGTCPGTPSYLAPERLLGRPYDTRADIYSVGVLMYELLTGVRPFSSKDPTRLARSHIEQPPPPVRSLCDVSPALERVVMRALEKDPNDRFLGASDMLAELEADEATAVPLVDYDDLEEETSRLELRIRLSQRSLLERFRRWLLRPFRSPGSMSTVELTLP